MFGSDLVIIEGLKFRVKIIIISLAISLKKIVFTMKNVKFVYRYQNGVDNENEGNSKCKLGRI